MKDKKLTAAPHLPHLSEVGNEREGFFETEHLDSVVKNLPEHLHDFVRLGFAIGWRKSALKSLRWTDVGSDVLYLRAKHSKTRKPVTVPLVGEVREIIERRRAAISWREDGHVHLSEYVFHIDGEAIRDFRKSWWTACVAAGVGKFVCPGCSGDVAADYKCATCGRTWKRVQLRYTGKIFHDFRRTAARNMVRAGVPVSIAMQITGHRTDSMFRRYAITDEDQKSAALAKTEAYLAAGEKKVVPIRRKAK
jgi:integrase